MEKLKMMVDMDDVLVYGNFFKLICEFLQKDIDINDVKIYYLQTLLGDKVDDFWKWMKPEDLYKDCPLIEGSYEVMQKYLEYIDFYITTAYLWNGCVDISGDTLKHKYEYLKSMLPFIDPKYYIFTTDKNIINFDIRLDDRDKSLKQGDLRMLYSAWHNLELSDDELSKSGIVRVNNWQDVDKQLEHHLGLHC